MLRMGRLVSLLLLPLVGIIVYSALRSYFFRDPPIWTFEMSLFLFGCFFMLGAAYCHAEKKHVAVDVLSHYLPPKWRRIQGIFSEGVVLFVALVLLYISIPNAWRSTMMLERSTHQTPFNPQIWWFRWVIPISCALISWQAFKDMLALILNKADRRQPDCPL
ncbi:TRAP transporter small permease subunit [Desulfonatronum lacustre]|uniref:TRAP transporter small permease subunit n=1 Tax=Desulfonatronum lacustre TaxID=66849 RepID=UPI0004B9F4FC|nr:TRAP transporter small permease [Desulfonatronum lacustre]